MLCADTMSFAGLAPEIINGRAAMFGMLAAFGAEVNTGEPVLAQVIFSQFYVAYVEFKLHILT